MKKDKEWILVPNCIFLSQNNDRFLSPEESYLFCLMYSLRIKSRDFTLISINGVNQICHHQFASVKKNGDASRNKKRIFELLDILLKKEYIIIDGGLKDKKNDELLFIEFYSISHYHTFAKWHNENITYEIFDLFESPLEFYIYAYIDCFGDRGRNISYKEWEDVIGSCHDVIEKTVEKMNSYLFKPRIWKISGNYAKEDENVYQDKNTYYTRPDKEIMKKWNGFYEKKEKIKGVGLRRKD